MVAGGDLRLVRARALVQISAALRRAGSTHLFAAVPELEALLTRLRAGTWALPSVQQAGS
jgi:hypothetical protein